MPIIIPAIDLIGGRCVRLTEGDYGTEKVFREDPVEQALEFEGKGAQRLHVVDLEAARTGKPANWEIVRCIAGALRIPVELGGGIRTLEAIERVFDLGVQFAILGTVACKNPELAEKAAAHWGERILVGIDARDGFVATDGWTQPSRTSAIDLAKRFEIAGIGGIIYTDIARDGRLQGPNLPAIKGLAEKVNIQIIASGGVSSIQDLLDIKFLGLANVSGIIVGKALYEGRFRLEEAIRALGMD